MDFCAILAEPWLRSSSHLAAHLLREIESALRDVLLPADYKAPKKGAGAHRAEIDAILTSVGLAEGELADQWRRLAGEDPLPRRAHRDNLAQPRPLSSEVRSAFSDFEAVLDVLLDRLESRFIDFLEKIDSLLEKGQPTAADADTIRKNLPNNRVTLAHFFGQASHPAWLPLLAERGFFDHPPEPLADEVAGTISFPLWPQSRYLVRMTAVGELQRCVATTALAIPPSTNPFVNTDLADVALALPAPLAVEFVPRAEQWLSTSYDSGLSLKLGELAAKLAAEGALSEAIDLLRIVFSSRTVEGAGGRHVQWVADELEEIVHEYVPIVVEAAGLSALRQLCDSLSGMLTLDHPELGRDYSYVWRRAVEDHQQDRDSNRDGRDSLVSSIRDASIKLAAAGSDQVEGILSLFAEYRWSIFRRLTLNLLHEVADLSTETVRKELHNRRSLTDPNLWHEYSRLLKRSFGALSGQERADLIHWIREGPVLADEEEGGLESGVDPRLLQKRTRGWRWRQLARFGDVLPSDLCAEFQELCEEFGPVDEPEFATSGGSVWVGPTSPQSAEDLGRLSLDEFFSFLRSWKPEGRFMAETREGLGRELGRTIAASPARYLEASDRFRELDKTYTRAVFVGLEEALKTGTQFPWAPVVRLAEWVVRQPSGSGNPVPPNDRELDWTGARRAIAYFIQTALASKSNPIPLNLRPDIWRVIARLADDPEPSPAYERKYGREDMHLYDLSLNTVRGVALNCAVAYGLWIDGLLRPDAHEEHARNLDDAPELRRLLEHHLNPERDSSLAIRSIYGRWFPWIAFLDRAWAAARVSQIFPAAEESRDLRDAAWASYVAYCEPYDDVLTLLSAEYSRSVERLADSPPDQHPRDRTEDHLAEHLMLFYLRGLLGLGGPPLSRFFELATGKLRRHAIAFVGRIVRNSGDIEAVVIVRAQALWDSRIEAAARSPEQHVGELEAFGWWFVAARFDVGWSASRLLRALGLWKRTEPRHLVLERLAQLPDHLLALAVQCLTHLVEDVSESWTPRGSDKGIKVILRRALAQVESAPAAQEVINRLAAHGDIEFRELLREGDHAPLVRCPDSVPGA